MSDTSEIKALYDKQGEGGTRSTVRQFLDALAASDIELGDKTIARIREVLTDPPREIRKMSARLEGEIENRRPVRPVSLERLTEIKVFFWIFEHIEGVHTTEAIASALGIMPWDTRIALMWLWDAELIRWTPVPGEGVRYSVPRFNAILDVIFPE